VAEALTQSKSRKL